MPANLCSDLLDWPRLWKWLRLCLRTFAWSVFVSLGLTLCFALLHQDPGLPSAFWPQRKSCYTPPKESCYTPPQIWKSFPHSKEHLENALCTDLIPASSPFQSDSGMVEGGGCSGGWHRVRMQKTLGPSSLTFSFFRQGNWGQGRETTNWRSQKLMSNLGLDLRIFNSQSTVFVLAEFTIDHGWNISCSKW